MFKYGIFRIGIDPCQTVEKPGIKSSLERMVLGSLITSHSFTVCEIQLITNIPLFL